MQTLQAARSLPAHANNKYSINSRHDSRVFALEIKQISKRMRLRRCILDSTSHAQVTRLGSSLARFDDFFCSLERTSYELNPGGTENSASVRHISSWLIPLDAPVHLHLLPNDCLPASCAQLLMQRKPWPVFPNILPHHTAYGLVRSVHVRPYTK